MNEHAKSLKLAELMGWSRTDNRHAGEMIETKWHCGTNIYCDIYPYEPHLFGRAQFADILLEFPQVMDSAEWNFDGGDRGLKDYGAKNQTNILDEILRMNGVEI